MSPSYQLGTIVDCFTGESTCLTRQIVFDGISQGLVYGLLAMGIVLIYRSTKVINFAVGNMGLPGTLLFALLILNWSAPFWLALAVCLALGAAIGAVVELTVVRRLFTSPRVILLVATVGVAQLMQAVLAAMPEVEGAAGAKYPVAVGRLFEPVEKLRVAGPRLTIIVVVPVVAVLLGWALNRTAFGKAVAASADNPDLSRLSGVNPKVISTFVWTIGGFLSTLSMILLSGGGGISGLQNLGPLTLSRALVAAVVAGMRSFPRAVVAGIVIGVLESALRFNFLDQAGLVDFVLFLSVLVAVFFQSRAGEDSVVAFTPRSRPIPERLRALWFVRLLPRITICWLFVVAFYVGHFVDTPSKLFLYSTIVGFAICGLSVTVITGWAGQLSLAQMAFAGVAALTAAAFTRGFEMDWGWSSIRLDFQWDPLPFGVSILIATVTTAGLAALIGIGALRVRGLLLAVTTFAFAIACVQYLYRRPVFSDGRSSVPFERGEIFGIDLAPQHRYLWFSLAGLAVVLAVVARLRNEGIGRTTIAVRDNADSAAAYTVSPTRTKLTAFALAGGITGLGGGILGGLVRNIRYSESLFLVPDSLRIVAIVVIGGLGSVIGPVLGALWVVGLPTFWPDNDIVPLLTSSMGLLIILMYFPGGFVQIVYAARDALLDAIDRRVAAAGARSSYEGPGPSRGEALAGLLAALVKGGASLGLIATIVWVDGVLGSIFVIFGVSGLAGAVVLLGLSRTPATEIGSRRAKAGITALVFFEPLVPFLWPAVFVEYARRATGRRDAPIGLARYSMAPTSSPAGPPPSIHRARPGPEIPPVALDVRDVTVRFGGNIAVSDVSIHLYRDEIVGLIGTNGAGKSTLMNAIGGFVPSTGTIELIGRDVSSLSAPRRARAGLGRTFQAATLFPELTVRETVQVALEARGHTSFWRSGLHLNGPAERRQRSEAAELIDFLGLGRYSDSYISDLSTGTRRIVEIAALLAVDARVLCLDELTAGVAQRETEAFAPLIKRIQAELGASMLVIEHDMPLIMHISDRVYCLETGTVIAEGTPGEVRNNPEVIAAYLGTDERAVERSDTVPG